MNLESNLDPIIFVRSMDFFQRRSAFLRQLKLAQEQ